MYNVFLYIVSNDGVDTSDSYPFKAKVVLLYTMYCPFTAGCVNKSTLKTGGTFVSKSAM